MDTQAAGGASGAVMAFQADDAQLLQRLPHAVAQRRNPLFADGHQPVLGRWRDPALPAGDLGAGGAGHYQQRHAHLS